MDSAEIREKEEDVVKFTIRENVANDEVKEYINTYFTFTTYNNQNKYKIMVKLMCCL